MVERRMNPIKYLKFPKVELMETVRIIKFKIKADIVVKDGVAMKSRKMLSD